MLIGLGVLMIIAGSLLSWPIHKRAVSCLQRNRVARFYALDGLAFVVPCAGFLIAALLISHAIIGMHVTS